MKDQWPDQPPGRTTTNLKSVLKDIAGKFTWWRLIDARRWDMSETFENLLRDLSDAEISGKTAKVAEICRRALDSPTVQSAPEKTFLFGTKLAALLLAEDEPIMPEEVVEGIVVLHKMLAFISREDNPDEWASIHLQLGSTFFREEQKLGTAITHFESALLILRHDRSPREWALAKIAAGQAYWRLGDRREQTIAIGYLQEALSFFTREKFPDDYREYAEQLASWKKAVLGFGLES